MTRKRKHAYPAGWHEGRIRKLADHYDNQTEDDQVAEHEAAFLAEGQTVMVVPTELVPEIVKLISKNRPAQDHASFIRLGRFCIDRSLIRPRDPVAAKRRSPLLDPAPLPVDNPCRT